MKKSLKAVAFALSTVFSVSSLSAEGSGFEPDQLIHQCEGDLGVASVMFYPQTKEFGILWESDAPQEKSVSMDSIARGIFFSVGDDEVTVRNDAISLASNKCYSVAPK